LFSVGDFTSSATGWTDYGKSVVSTSVMGAGRRIASCGLLIKAAIDPIGDVAAGKMVMAFLTHFCFK